MNNLGDYFGELACREGRPKTKLVAAWSSKEISRIRRCLKGAFDRCRFDERPLLLAKNITGQAMGNRLASYFATKVGTELRAFRIQSCAGQGYPDRCLLRMADKRRYALELKATRRFEPTSTNRMSLTCSSSKLRRHFAPPIRHLLVTALYKRDGSKVWIYDFRADFLEPSTKVNVRLEASVSHHILAKSNHASFWGLKIESAQGVGPGRLSISDKRGRAKGAPVQ